MEVAIFTPVQLLGESLGACLNGIDDIHIVGVACDWDDLEACLTRTRAQLVIMDVSAGIELQNVDQFVARWPTLLLLALGLREQCHEVVQCGRAGFVGYVARDASIGRLRRAILDAGAGRLVCSEEIAGSLLREVRRSHVARAAAPAPVAEVPPLTVRESEVAHLIVNGCSNKEIARELTVSLATVKHHVHNILAKMHVPSRARVARVLQAAIRRGECI